MQAENAAPEADILPISGAAFLEGYFSSRILFSSCMKLLMSLN